MDFALENVSNVVAACVLWEKYGTAQFKLDTCTRVSL